MNRILILFAHPRFEQSRINRVLVDHLPAEDGITFHDLYEEYTDFSIDVEREKQLLLDHDLIIWHHPLYWYSAPPLLKQWIDMVLEFKWAYGPNGDALAGKYVFNVFTSGGPPEAYRPEGSNRYTINEFFRPFEQTARLCQMHYLPPFGEQGSHRLSLDELMHAGADYGNLLHLLLAEPLHPSAFAEYTMMNEWLEARKINVQ